MENFVFSHLIEKPYHFSFYQVVRLIDTNNLALSKIKPQWRLYTPGHDNYNFKESVRFYIDHHLVAPKGEITEFSPSTTTIDGTAMLPAKIKVTLAGLTGSSAVLPMHYTELVLKQNRRRQTALADFFNIFNHRNISFQYRVWERNRPAFIFERHRREGKFDPLTSIFNSLIGHQSKMINPFNDVFRYYAGLFAKKHKSAANLAGMLSDYFKTNVKVKQFVGEWNGLRSTELTRLPSKTLSGQHHQLSKNAIIGKRVWFSQNKFRVIVGPLPRVRYIAFLPGSLALDRLRKIVNKYNTDNLSYDIQLLLDAKTMPQYQLSAKHPSRLGYEIWLHKDQQNIETEKLIVIGN